MTAIISCRDLCKTFGPLQALDNVNLEIHDKSSTGLIGANGAGKTTLLSIICGFLNPSHGRVSIAGHASDRPALKGRIGIQPQDTPLLRGIAVYDQLILFARLQGRNNQAARKEIARIVDLLQIGTLVIQFPETLSHGQRKKVCLAQALIGEPDVILLDEPTAGLDPVAANDVRRIIQQLRERHTLVISSHNLEEIRTICDDIIIIDRGKIIKQCAINDLIEQNSTLTVLLAAPATAVLKESLQALATVTGVETDKDNPRRLTVLFRNVNGDELQYKILECLRGNGAGIVEFSRGSAFTDKVMELVGSGSGKSN